MAKKTTFTIEDDKYIRETMLEAIEKGEGINATAAKLSEEMGRNVSSILSRWYLYASDSKTERLEKKSDKRIPWSTRMQPDKWALMMAMSEELGIDKTEVFSRALESYIGTLDDQEQERVIQRQIDIMGKE